jgi:hypothetical protein
MAGTFTQLNALGKQDLHLGYGQEKECDKIFSFWGQTVFKCPKLFALESKEAEFTRFGYGLKCTSTLPRVADLVRKLYLQVNLGALPAVDANTPMVIDGVLHVQLQTGQVVQLTPSGTMTDLVTAVAAVTDATSWAALSTVADSVPAFTAPPVNTPTQKGWLVPEGTRKCVWVEDAGRALIQEVRLEIGSVIIDTLQGEFLRIDEELTTLKEKQLGYGRFSDSDALTVADVFSPAYRFSRNLFSSQSQKILVEIPFYFHKDSKNAFPLIATHLNDVNVTCVFRKKNDVVMWHPAVAQKSLSATEGAMEDCKLHIESVFVGDQEREELACMTRTYTITQTQYTGALQLGAQRNQKIELTLNHPVKELIFVMRKRQITDEEEMENRDYFDFSGPEPGLFMSPFKTLTFLFNGNQRFTPQTHDYFTVVQPKLHHARIPVNANIKSQIGVYSFAMVPEHSEATGSCNFSRIDKFYFQLEFSDPTMLQSADYEMHVYARNFNWLTIYNGVATLSYAS